MQDGAKLKFNIKNFVSLMWITYVGYIIGAMCAYRNLLSFVNFWDPTVLLILLTITAIVWKIWK